MKRKTFVTFAAALLAGSLFGAGTASAFLLVDDFDTTQAVLTDITTAGSLSNVADTDPLPAADTDLTSPTRTMTVNYSSQVPMTVCTVTCAVSVVSGGVWTFNLATGAQGFAEMEWSSFGIQDLTDMGAINISIEIVSAGVSFGAGSVVLTLMDSGALTETLTESISTGMFFIISFALTDFVVVDITKITKITFRLDGTAAADMDLQATLIGNIPEPATLALFGIGLLGLGLLSRRRRRSEPVG